MAGDVNPYAPPGPIEPVLVPPAALQSLRAPALGLFLLAGFMCLGIPMIAFAAVMQVAIVVRRIQFGLDPFPELPDRDDALGLCAGAVCVASSTMIVRGAFLMRSGKNYRAALTAAMLSCIPVLSPLYFVGIPFGIWALVVLRRPAVRAAFTS